MSYAFCETIAATGAWHIRILTGSRRHLAGIPYSEDRQTLCGLLAAWDVVCEIDEAALAVSHERPGHPCASCKKKYLDLREGT